MKLRVLSSLLHHCQVSDDQPPSTQTMDLTTPGKAEDLSMTGHRGSDHYKEYPLKLKFKSRSFREVKLKRDEIGDQARYKVTADATAYRYDNLAWHQTLMYRNQPTGSPPQDDNDLPLDMSIKSQASPVPSRPSVITRASSFTSYDCISDEERQRTSESGMCDPVIDEHFRRSLGKDYPNYFDNKLPSKPEDSENVSVTVDDHFAKALGDTWLTLQQKSKSKQNLPRSNSSSPGLYHRGIVS